MHRLQANEFTISNTCIQSSNTLNKLGVTGHAKLGHRKIAVLVRSRNLLMKIIFHQDRFKCTVT